MFLVQLLDSNVNPPLPTTVIRKVFKVSARPSLSKLCIYLYMIHFSRTYQAALDSF